MPWEIEMIRIIKYNIVNRGYVIAEVDVSIVGWNISFRKIQECSKGKNRWFNFPAFSEGEQQDKKWINYIEFESKQVKDKFFNAVREKVDEFIASNPAVRPDPSKYKTRIE